MSFSRIHPLLFVVPSETMNRGFTVHIFVIYFTTLSAAQTIKQWMMG
jgi:hypothetical protein